MTSETEEKIIQLLTGVIARLDEIDTTICDLEDTLIEKFDELDNDLDDKLDDTVSAICGSGD